MIIGSNIKKFNNIKKLKLIKKTHKLFDIKILLYNYNIKNIEYYLV